MLRVATGRACSRCPDFSTARGHTAGTTDSRETQPPAVGVAAEARKPMPSKHLGHVSYMQRPSITCGHCQHQVRCNSRISGSEDGQPPTAFMTLQARPLQCVDTVRTASASVAPLAICARTSLIKRVDGVSESIWSLRCKNNSALVDGGRSRQPLVLLSVGFRQQRQRSGHVVLKGSRRVVPGNNCPRGVSADNSRRNACAAVVSWA